MLKQVSVGMLAVLVCACSVLPELPWGRFEAQSGDDFMWGVANAGIQVEGYNDNGVWSEWERKGKTKHPIGRAVDFWNRYDEDFALAQAMGMKAFRISVEWSRLEPQPGKYDLSAVRRYRQMVVALRQRGLVPVLTLFHWNHPTWLEKRVGPNGKTGWENPESAVRFAAFTRLVAMQIAPDVKWWITFNEPNVWTMFSHLIGVVPPGKRGPLTYLRAKRNILAAHRAAYQVLHEVIPEVMVSANVNQIMFELGRGSQSEELEGIDLKRDMGNWPGSMPTDYVSFDYYYTFRHPKELLSIAKPWVLPIKASGIYDVIMDYHRRYGKPIMVAENGISTLNGNPRQDGWTRESALVQHAYHVQRARQDGANVVGYFHWSLTDNWEWGGYDGRFGLFSIDILGDPTLTRTPTPAVAIYSQIAQNGVSQELVRAFPAPNER